MTMEAINGYEEVAFAPLDWGMTNAGCTSMKYKEPGKGWETL